MKASVKPSRLIVPALALAYAAFLVWWLNRDAGLESAASQGQPERVSALPVPVQPASLEGGTSSQSGVGEDGVRASSQGVAKARLSARPVQSSELSAFKPVLYSEGQPHYAGELATAYVRVGSTEKQVALTVNQGGGVPAAFDEAGRGGAGVAGPHPSNTWHEKYYRSKAK